jgi:hypothetical protein
MTVMNLDKLEVWFRAKNFALEVYKEVVPHLPSDEKWILTKQLKRAAQSGPANIADIARGSLTEVQSHMTLAHDLGYLPDEIYKRMTAHAESIGKQLNNYIAYLKRSKQGEKEFPAGYTVREKVEPYFPDIPDEDPTV